MPGLRISAAIVLLASVTACCQPQRYVKVAAKRKPADRDWTLRDTRTLDLLDGFDADKRVELSRYGGRGDRKAPATGYFYAGFVDGRWWLVDPDGNLFIHVGVCSIGRGKSQISRQPAVERFGSWEKWAQFANGLLADHGFNGSGGWTDAELLRAAPKPPVYTLSWSFMGSFGRSLKLTHQQPGHLGYPNSCIPVFHPKFEEFCDNYAAQLADTASDRWLLGHFSDNELPVVADMLDKSLQLDGSNPDLRPGREAALVWLKRRRGPDASAADIADEDRRDFLVYALERYFAVTTAAIRRHDPNHLCLGPRLHGRSLSMPWVLAVAGRYLDVVAANYYGAWAPNAEKMAMWVEQAGKPFIITEFYAKGHDVGLANTSGAGWLVPTQRDRGLFYQNFTLGLLESRGCVGWHWFKYRDNNPLDLSTDPSNRDSNKGVVNYRYEPYADLLAAMKQLNERVYCLIDYFDSR